MDDPLDPREAALRQLPLPYSLALRLRDAGVTDELLCDYLSIERDALPALLSLAQAKLAAALKIDEGRHGTRCRARHHLHHPTPCSRQMG
nr:hypothetical protein [Rhodococcus sp. UNC363MFTsu5.1]